MEYGIISNDTKLMLVDLCDYMCGLATDLNSINFDLLLRKREEFLHILNIMVDDNDTYTKT